jgi:hypothetical protein
MKFIVIVSIVVLIPCGDILKSCLIKAL